MKNRTDIHRTAALIPTDYIFVGIEIEKPEIVCLDEDDWPIYEIADNSKEIEAFRLKHDAQWADHKDDHHCHICGAALKYTAVFHHPKTNVLIRTGHDCANKLALAIDEENLAAFKHFKKAAAEILKRKAGIEKAKLTNPDLDERSFKLCVGPEAYQKFTKVLLTDNYRPHAKTDHNWKTTRVLNGISTIHEIVGKAVKRGWPLTEAQTDYCNSLWAQYDNFLNSPVQDEPVSQHLGAVGEYLDVEGVISFQKQFETQFGMGGLTIIKDSNGNLIQLWRVWDTSKPGDTVTFSGKVKEHSQFNGSDRTIIGGRLRGLQIRRAA